MLLKDGTETEDRRLDRFVHFDERSRNFGVAALAGAVPKDKVWWMPRKRQGDQGREGACVQYGITHALLASPSPAALAVARQVWKDNLIYWEAQRRDPYPGGEYPGAYPVAGGTSVLCGLQVAVELGFCDAYYWAFGLDQAVLGISTVCPAVIGVWWKAGMMEPGPGGLIEATGANVGGHCVAVIGVDYGRKFAGGRVEDVAVIAQSWGPTYGDGGRVYLPLAQLGELLADDGECAFPTSRRALKKLAV